MGSFIVRRAALGAVVAAVLSFVSFLFLASQFAPFKGQPLLPAYWTWVKGLWGGASLHPNLGTSPLPSGALERATLGSAVAHTALLLVGALGAVVVLSVAVAVVAARFRGSVLDLMVRAGTYLAWGIPAFLLALLLQQALVLVGSGHGVGPFPVAGWPGFCPAGIGLDSGTLNPCPAAGDGLTYLWNLFRYLLFPVLILSVAFVGLHSRYLRSALVGNLAAPFVVTARAKGLPESRVLLRHALRTSLVTFASGVLADFGALFGASLAVDWIFQLGGVGSLFINQFPANSPAPPDVYAIQLILLVSIGIVVASSLLGEAAIFALDPRLRGRL